MKSKTSNYSPLAPEEVLALVKTWGSCDWVQKASEYRKGLAHISLTDDAAREIGKKARKAIERLQPQEATRWALIGLVLSDGTITTQAKFCDELRPSVHTKEIEARLHCLVETLSNLHSEVLQSPELHQVADRLSSLRNFAALYRTTRSDEDLLLKNLHTEPEISLHIMLARVEMAFAEPPTRRTVPLANTINEMDKEEIASGASYAIEAYNKAYGLSSSQFRSFTASDPSPTAYDQDLVLANHLRELIEMEIRVYRYSYNCIRISDAFYEVSPPSDRFGMALSLGYILHAQAPHLQLTGIPENSAAFAQAAESFVEKFGDKVMWLEGKSDSQRLVLGFPAEVLSILSEKLFLPQAFFADEGAEIRNACFELLTPVESLLSFELIPGLSLLDAIRIQRVFRFMGLIRMRTLLKGSVPLAAARNSVLGAMEKGRLIQILEAVGFSPKAIEGFLQLCIWDTTSKGFWDIQYQPLFSIGPLLGLPFLVLGFSNIVRNGLHISQSRLHPDGENNPVEALVTHAMAEAGATTSAGINYEYASQKGQVDVLAKIGNDVFAFECKETLLPCSAFEQRTTWDYLEKGSEQLDRFATAWKDNEFRRQLGKNLDWDLSSATLKTCIVFSHRLLSGTSFRGHPVRQVKELANYLTRAISTITISGETYDVPMRQGGPLSAEGIFDYLSEEGKSYSAYWKAFTKEYVTWSFHSVQLQIPRYGFDPIRHLALLGILSEDLSAKLHHAGECLSTAQREFDGSPAALERHRRFHERVMRLMGSAARALKSRYSRTRLS